MSRRSGRRLEPLRGEVGEAVRDFVAELERRRLRPSYVRELRRTLASFARALAHEGAKRLLELESEVVVRSAETAAREVALGHRSRELAPSNVAARLQVIRRWTRWLRAEGRTLGDVGAAIPRMRVPRSIPKRVLSERRVARLYAVTAGSDPLRQRDRALVEVLYAAGARRSEAAALEVRDLDFADGLLTIRKGKGDKPRVVPLPRRSVAALTRYVCEGRPLLLRRPDGGPRRRDTGVLLLSFTGRPLRANGVEVKLRKLARRAGLRSLAPHALRHAIATHLVRAGVSIRHVQLFLGHANIQTTAIYTHLARRDLRAVLERTHPRERGRPETRAGTGTRAPLQIARVRATTGG